MSYRATANPIDAGCQPHEGVELTTGTHQCAANALVDLGHQIDREPWPPAALDRYDRMRFEDCAPAYQITIEKVR